MRGLLVLRRVFQSFAFVYVVVVGYLLSTASRLAKPVTLPDCSRGGDGVGGSGGGRPPGDASATATTWSRRQRKKHEYGSPHVVPVVERPVRFLTWDDFDLEDTFSASWLQPTEAFLRLPVETIGIVEDAAFRAFKAHGEENAAARMTVDWLDFSVEHLSKWWDVLGILDGDPERNPNASSYYNTTIGRLTDYVARKGTACPEKGDGGQMSGCDDLGLAPLRETIAIVAFRMYRDRNLTVSSLAATVASLRWAGFGRVIVVGHEAERAKEEDVVREAFRMVANGFLRTGEHGTASTRVDKIGATEVQYVTVSDMETEYIKVNVPFGAVAGLQRALGGKLGSNETRLWVGDVGREYWKYVYLTEPDTILLTKPYVLPRLKEALDSGLVLSPHRLQPIPHEGDVALAGNGDEYGERDKDEDLGSRYLPKRYFPVIDLDPSRGDACCDLGPYRPGQRPNMVHCGWFWWMCGFLDHHTEQPISLRERHKRLLPYDLMKIRDGVGIVSLAGSESGRQCLPTKGAECPLARGKD